MYGMVKNCMFKQAARPKVNRLVVGTKLLHKREIRQHGEVEKYNCRRFNQGFCKSKVGATRKISDRVNPDAFGDGSG